MLEILAQGGVTNPAQHKQGQARLYSPLGCSSWRQSFVGNPSQVLTRGALVLALPRPEAASCGTMAWGVDGPCSCV